MNAPVPQAVSIGGLCDLSPAYIRAIAPYQPGKRSWVKVKCHQRQEFVIGGYTKSDKTGRLARPPFAGLSPLLSEPPASDPGLRLARGRAALPRLNTHHPNGLARD